MYLAAPLALRDGDRRQLEALARSSSVRSDVAQRALIVLLAAEGLANTEIARLAGTSRPTVLKWRHRYQVYGVAGLDDDRRPGRPVTIDEFEVLSETLADGGTPPAQLGVTHWSARLMADRLGISFASVARIWRKYDIQPHRIERFEFSTKPKLEAKIREVVGLYLSPSAAAVVVSADDQTHTPARSRAQPSPLPQSLPEQQIRNCTTGLIAALEAAVDEFNDLAYLPQYTDAEFIDFLDGVSAAHPAARLHVICADNATPDHPTVAAWRGDNPTVRMHCGPTACSWPSTVGIFFGITLRQAIRRGTYASIDDLVHAMHTYVDDSDKRSRPFLWMGENRPKVGKSQT
jgi:transposase